MARRQSIEVTARRNTELWNGINAISGRLTIFYPPGTTKVELNVLLSELTALARQEIEAL